MKVLAFLLGLGIGLLLLYATIVVLGQMLAMPCP